MTTNIFQGNHSIHIINYVNTLLSPQRALPEEFKGQYHVTVKFCQYKVDTSCSSSGQSVISSHAVALFSHQDSTETWT